jgi:hypothetical protein
MWATAARRGRELSSYAETPLPGRHLGTGGNAEVGSRQGSHCGVLARWAKTTLFCPTTASSLTLAINKNLAVSRPRLRSIVLSPGARGSDPCDPCWYYDHETMGIEMRTQPMFARR